tara:strand:- start:122 stop:286 length:165 start_codon:yes stop_codon:yes gene_type:complete
MKKLLQNNNTTLFFAIINGIFAVNSFANQNWLWGMVAFVCCAICTTSYLNSISE